MRYINRLFTYSLTYIKGSIMTSKTVIWFNKALCCWTSYRCLLAFYTKAPLQLSGGGRRNNAEGKKFPELTSIYISWQEIKLREVHTFIIFTVSIKALRWDSPARINNTGHEINLKTNQHSLNCTAASRRNKVSIYYTTDIINYYRGLIISSHRYSSAAILRVAVNNDNH